MFSLNLNKSRKLLFISNSIKNNLYLRYNNYSTHSNTKFNITDGGVEHHQTMNDETTTGDQKKTDSKFNFSKKTIVSTIIGVTGITTLFLATIDYYRGKVSHLNTKAILLEDLKNTQDHFALLLAEHNKTESHTKPTRYASQKNQLKEVIDACYVNDWPSIYKTVKSKEFMLLFNEIINDCNLQTAIAKDTTIKLERLVLATTRIDTALNGLRASDGRYRVDKSMGVEPLDLKFARDSLMTILDKLTVVGDRVNNDLKYSFKLKEQITDSHWENDITVEYKTLLTFILKKYQL
ncbi:hypothetical protein PPL_02261 [Heterostelium album PN500]|uniref:Uncharacterized protein n=1 Tax=Heterostelium pallidum (strain ATCC 26659 / Pp 5 / PN500) TaxID=670386 RepID=D3B1T7_HETP5|nr:hypothetical protein PPL_02261 [Heterostelium album PN500]EFA85261.1 hypothetical protein PPL_02261 [Heterostelium album PN500]|eukprot:XP_020437370.1 hypothetical protein PPL_02261 [Heterostelium album PN500]